MHFGKEYARMRSCVRRRLGLAIGWRCICLPALTVLLGSCADQGGRPLSPLAPPEPPAAASREKTPPPQADIAPLAAAHKAKPADPAAALAYARVLRESGTAREALAVLDKASALKPADKRLLLERGLLALDLGDPAKAEALLKKAHDDKAPSWRLHSGLGAALASRGKQLDAQVEFAKALTLAPDHPSVLNNLALSYALDGKIADAERLLRKARRADGAQQSPKVQQNLALVLGLSGKYEEARTAGAAALSAARAQDNVAYLEALTGPRTGGTQTATAPAERKPDPAKEPAAAKQSASLPQPAFGLGGPGISDR
jgi:Flp pilus assembly protein TadD